MTQTEHYVCTDMDDEWCACGGLRYPASTSDGVDKLFSDHVAAAARREATTQDILKSIADYEEERKADLARSGISMRDTIPTSPPSGKGFNIPQSTIADDTPNAEDDPERLRAEIAKLSEELHKAQTDLGIGYSQAEIAYLYRLIKDQETQISGLREANRNYAQQEGKYHKLLGIFQSIDRVLKEEFT